MRDKTYIAVADVLLLNVTGDIHPPGRVYASLKYIHGRKWTDGYSKAIEFLQHHDPELVDEDGFISVPVDRVDRCFDPFRRWQELLEEPSLSRLHREACTLAETLATILGFRDFGITDSLLWGNGHDNSDIDLIVRGRDNATKLMKANQLYQFDDFSRPSAPIDGSRTATELHAPYAAFVPDWPRILARKQHMGLFRDRHFSLRVVLDDSELARLQQASIHWTQTARRARVHFTVADWIDAWLFPAIYRNTLGDELIDYSVIYEGALRPGDELICECDTLQSDSTPHRRYILQNVIEFRPTEKHDLA